MINHKEFYLNFCHTHKLLFYHLLMIKTDLPSNWDACFLTQNIPKIHWFDISFHNRDDFRNMIKIIAFPYTIVRAENVVCIIITHNFNSLKLEWGTVLHQRHHMLRYHAQSKLCILWVQNQGWEKLYNVILMKAAGHTWVSLYIWFLTKFLVAIQELFAVDKLLLPLHSVAPHMESEHCDHLC